MATTRSQGIQRKDTELANAAVSVLMVNADMRDLTLASSGTITWTMTVSDVDAINAGTAVWVACPAAVDGVIKMEGFTVMAVRAVSGANGSHAIALYKS